VASNVSCRPLLEITDAGRSHRYMFLQVFLWPSLNIWPMLK
jgi:hypothetical protein